MSVQIGAGPAYVSYSSFTQWLKCGKQWQLQRHQKVTETPSWWLSGGKAVHTATENYDTQLYAETGR